VRLYVVDDLAAARALVRAVAEGLDYEVVGEAGDGAAACEAIPPLEPDVVVMDWQMPEMDGLRATRLLVERLPGLAVVAYSAIEGAAIGELFREAGAVAHVGKGDVIALQSVLEALRAAG
jgi:two-component system, NarL family, invasion response regulator UvrY